MSSVIPQEVKKFGNYILTRQKSTSFDLIIVENLKCKSDMINPILSKFINDNLKKGIYQYI